MVASAFVVNIRRKWTEANMITGPAWMLDGRAFIPTTGTARASA
jgi:hypothetical protein